MSHVENTMVRKECVSSLFFNYEVGGSNLMDCKIS